MAEGLAGRRIPVPSEGATDRQPTLSGMSGSVPGLSKNSLSDNFFQPQDKEGENERFDDLMALPLNPVV